MHRTGPAWLGVAGHTSAVTALSLLADGVVLATLDYDGFVAHLDVRDGAGAGATPSSRRIASFAAAPAGDALLLGLEGAGLFRWAQGGEAPRRELPALADVRALAVAPRAGLVVVAGAAHDVAVVAWEGRRALPALRRRDGPWAQVWALAVSPDGRFVALSEGDEPVRVFETAGGGLVAALDALLDPCVALAFAPDGSALLTGTIAGEVARWDTADLSCPTRLPRHRAAVTALAFAPDGRRFASVSWSWRDDTGEVWLWDADATAPTPLHALASGPMRGPGTALCFSAEGRRLYAGSPTDERGGVAAWDLNVEASEGFAPPTPAGARGRTGALVRRRGRVAVWLSAEGFDEHALGLGRWDHDAEEHSAGTGDVAEALRNNSHGGAFADAAAAVAARYGLRACADAFLLYHYVWDVEPGPVAGHPHVIYLGALTCKP